MPGALAIVPFALFLLALAVAPLAIPERWERHHTKAALALALGAPGVGALAFGALGMEGREALAAAGRDYVSFVSYLTALYTIASGVRLRGRLEATPWQNAVILVAGAALASVIGTAGASLLLIQLLLKANRRRRERALPVIFFIFIVANGGGLLTPLGDPPLYLGFLRGVPFLWPLENLVGVWATFVGLTIGAYVAIELVRGRGGRAPPERTEEAGPPLEPLRVEGWTNIALLAFVVVCSYMSGKVGAWWVSPLAFLALTAASLGACPPSRREDFSWHPLIELGVVFAGIFATLAPVLPVLRQNAAALPLDGARNYFLLGGALSSVLDNAPTYLVLLEIAGHHGAGTGVGTTGVPAAILGALSCGCVLMGANTYIGNGPNLLVRSLAERDGVAMPGFVRYSAWALVVLGPIYVVLVLLFFR